MIDGEVRLALLDAQPRAVRPGATTDMRAPASRSIRVPSENWTFVPEAGSPRI